MGLRPTRSRFMPSVYVFPGGRVDPLDHKVAPARSASQATEKFLARQPGPKTMSLALANAAIRETFEETGLRLTKPGKIAQTDGTWAEMAKLGEAPDHGALLYLGRAITPRGNPIRFHARFFVADAEELEGTLTETEELADLAFRPIEDALKLPIIDVTELMLRSVEQVRQTPDHQRPFLRYRAQKAMVTFET